MRQTVGHGAQACHEIFDPSSIAFWACDLANGPPASAPGRVREITRADANCSVGESADARHDEVVIAVATKRHVTATIAIAINHGVYDRALKTSNARRRRARPMRRAGGEGLRRDMKLAAAGIFKTRPRFVIAERRRQAARLPAIMRPSASRTA